MVVQLATALSIAAGVIDLAPSTGTLKTSLVGHIGLGADDWLDALGPTFFVEVENAIHVAVIGHTESGLTIGDRFGDKFIKLGGAIEHRKLGVNVEMGERVAQHQPPYVSVEPDEFGNQISSIQISTMWLRNSSSDLEVSSWESAVVGDIFSKEFRLSGREKEQTSHRLLTNHDDTPN